MAKLPFSIFRRAGRRYYYVQFKNEETGEYYPAISTKQETEPAATKTAFDWLRDGIPRKRDPVKVQDLSLKDTARKINIRRAELCGIPNLTQQSKRITPIGCFCVFSHMLQIFDLDSLCTLLLHCFYARTDIFQGLSTSVFITVLRYFAEHTI